MCDPLNKQAKFCTGDREYPCCHPIEFHDMERGCTVEVESSICDSKWICGCKCVICIHRNLLELQAERKAILIEEERQIEKILNSKPEILIQEEAIKPRDGL